FGRGGAAGQPERLSLYPAWLVEAGGRVAQRSAPVADAGRLRLRQREADGSGRGPWAEVSLQTAPDAQAQRPDPANGAKRRMDGGGPGMGGPGKRSDPA